MRCSGMGLPAFVGREGARLYKPVRAAGAAGFRLGRLLAGRENLAGRDPLRVATIRPARGPNEAAPVPVDPPLLKILALETSTEFCSAALWLDGTSRQRIEHAGQRHSSLLLPMVDSLLAEAELRLAGLDGIAVSIGPGSFTGVRIATAVGQGLAFGADLPVAGVGTLDALAWSLEGDALLACLDARMGEIYAAAFRRDATGLVPVFGPVVAAAAALPALPGGTWSGGGNAFERHAAGLALRWPGGVVRVDAAASPEARHVAALAAWRHPGGLPDAPETLVPLYVRDKVALTLEER